MKQNSPLELYKKLYTDLQFERAGLFQAVKEKYGGNSALYPGSFVHITPSFFFPHVVYIDRHPEAQEFFAGREAVLDYISRNKQYKRSAYLQFIAQDYSQPLPLSEEFDLLIALHADGIVPPCKKYLKRGGLLLTNTYRLSVEEAASDLDFTLVSIVQFQKGSYTCVEDDLDKILLARSKKAGTQYYLKQRNRGLVYTENEDYYIFRKSFKPGG